MHLLVLFNNKYQTDFTYDKNSKSIVQPALLMECH